MVVKARPVWATNSRTFHSPRPGRSHSSGSIERTTARNERAASANRGRGSLIANPGRSLGGRDQKASVLDGAQRVLGVATLVHVTGLLGPGQGLGRRDAVVDL